jgi:predicted dinucleotide-binding enzyme
MRIGVIGAGMIGGTAARLFAAVGHDVLMANSRGRESLLALADEIGVIAADLEPALEQAELVLLAIPFGRYRDIPTETTETKIVVDATNYCPRRDGAFSALDDGSTTSSELVAEHLRGARLVKAFNTMYYRTLAEGGDSGRARSARLTIFVSGDDALAKRAVGNLIEEIGFAAVDLGSLREGGRLQQPGSALYNQPITAAEAEDELR